MKGIGSFTHDIKRMYEEIKEGKPIWKVIAGWVLIWLIYYGKDIWEYLCELVK